MINGKVDIQHHLAISPSLSPAKTGVFKRSCACGQHAANGSKCIECRKKYGGTLHGAALNTPIIPEISHIVHEVLRSPGHPLDAKTRAFMKPRFGRDFSKVRVHANSTAANSAQTVSARAHTVGRDLVFGRGEYKLETNRGQQLLDHELTHVVQQETNRSSSSIEALYIDSPSSAADAEVKETSSHVFDGTSLSPSVSMRTGVIQCDDTEAGRGIEEDETRLRWPGQHRTYHHPRLLFDSDLRLDPELQAQYYAMRMVRQLLDPDNIRTSLLQIDFNTFLATQPPSWQVRQTPLTREPVVPRGAGPSTPRRATGGDVAQAFLQIPAVQLALTQLRAEAEDRTRQEWIQLVASERALVITHTVLFTGMALSGIVTDPEAQEFVLNLVQDQPIPIPGIHGLTVQFNLLRPNQMIRFDPNVGALFPLSFGFR